MLFTIHMKNPRRHPLSKWHAKYHMVKKKKKKVPFGSPFTTYPKTTYLLKGVQPDCNSKCKRIFHSEYFC